MKIDTPHEELVLQIRSYGRTSWDNSQVAGRLKKLLPDRLKSLKASYRVGRKAGAAEREALNDENYLKFVDEYLDVVHDAWQARVQYETHLMLLEARRSLRPFRRHGFQSL